jgi:hypothetical protein
VQIIKLNYIEDFQPQIVDVCLSDRHRNHIIFGFLGCDAVWSCRWFSAYLRKVSPPCSTLRYYPGIYLEVLRKTTRNLSQHGRSPSRDMNPGPPEYEAGVLTTWRRRSVFNYLPNRKTCCTRDWTYNVHFIFSRICLCSKHFSLR